MVPQYYNLVKTLTRPLGKSSATACKFKFKVRVVDSEVGLLCFVFIACPSETNLKLSWLARARVRVAHKSSGCLCCKLDWSLRLGAFFSPSESESKTWDSWDTVGGARSMPSPSLLFHMRESTTHNISVVSSTDLELPCTWGQWVYLLDDSSGSNQLEYEHEHGK
jgi:hypothetical protein